MSSAIDVVRTSHGGAHRANAWEPRQLMTPTTRRWLARGMLVVGLAVAFIAGPTFSLSATVTVLAGAAVLRVARSTAR